MLENNNGKPKPKYKMVHISFIPEELEKVDDFINKQVPKPTRSEFVREAIRDKIRRTENPELFNKAGKTINSLMMAQIAEDTKKVLELQELVLKRTDIINDMRETLDLIQEISKQKDLGEETETIKTLLKAHKELSQKEIREKTNLSRAIVFSIISNTEIFKFNVKTGRFSLR